MTLRKTLSITIATLAISCSAASSNLLAGTAPIITYSAIGTFASTPISGLDTLKLAGEPFSVSISVSESTAPYKHGPNWAAYNKLKLTGIVHSGLVGTSPITIGSSEASIILAYALAPTQYDMLTMEAPIQVVGISLNIKAVIIMPYGTFTSPRLQPFSNVALAPGNATMTYSDGTASTELAIQTGTLSATIPSGSPTATKAAVVLHSNGAEAVTLYADGTVSERSIGTSDVEVQIARQEVPVGICRGFRLPGVG
jgi:hypothetical protein